MHCETQFIHVIRHIADAPVYGDRISTRDAASLHRTATTLFIMRLPRPRPASLRTLRITTAIALVALVSLPAAAQTVGSSLIPSAQRVQWHDDLAFKDDWMYGGRLALQFGKFVELQPFYFMRKGLGLDTARAESVFGAAALGQRVDLQHYGTTVQLNLGDGAIVPFARAGAGILRLEPDSAERQDRITVSAGGGLRFAFGGLNAEVYAEQMGFRMNPRGLFGPDTSTGATAPTLRNIVYGAALTFPLSAVDDDYEESGLRGSTAPIEPFVGRLRYTGGHGLPRQDLAGVRAGIDFSPVFGLRGFYWRGLNEDRDGTVPVTGYGGEAQFNLNTGPGISPYLIVGAGQIDYGDGFRDSLDAPRADKTAFILGAGASFRLSDRLRINGAVRDYVMTLDDDLDAVATTGDLTHNTMLTAGLTISFGGRSTPTAADRERAWERDRTMREQRELRDERRQQELRERDTERERRLNRLTLDSARAARDARDGVRVPSSDSAGARWITIPVPTQGEIILRYGMPPRPDSAAPQRDTLLRAPSSEDLAARLLEIERRLTARIDAIQQGRPVPPVTMIVPSDTFALDRERAATPVLQRFRQTRTSDLRPYLGLGVGDGNAQFVLGLRADLGPMNTASGFRFVPELAVGLGEGSMSVLALANVQYPFGSVAGTGMFRPYITLGAGVFSPTVLAINTAVGSSIALRPGSDSPLYLHVELQGLNLFDHTRVLFSLSRGR